MGDIAVAKRLLNEGADINALDGHGRTTALGVAADGGSLPLVELFVSKGADVNKGCPLYYAAQNGHLQVARVLLHAGAEPNRFRVGQTPSPLLAAARGGHVDMVKLLVTSGSELGMKDGDNSPLIAAANNGHPNVVEYLAARGSSVNTASSEGWTALHVAANNGSLDLVRVLMKHGANPDYRNRAGKTPRQIAEEKGHKALVQIMEAAQRQ